MNYNFKMLNSKVLIFDPIKDIEKIRFNHYIMRKENKNRLSGELKFGQFKMTIKTVMEDLNLSKSKAERMIKEFENLNIIRCINKGNVSKGYSIYEYVTSNNIKHNKKSFMTDNVKEDISHNDIGNFSYINKFDNFYKSENEDNFMIDNDKECMKENMNSKINNLNKNLNKNKLYENIITYLNEVTKKNFRKNSNKTIRLINARLNEGFCEEDFYKVIDVKANQWIKTDMQKFLRPETLFSNKFEGYLNEVVNENNKIENIEQKGYWDIEFDF